MTCVSPAVIRSVREGGWIVREENEWHWKSYNGYSYELLGRSVDWSDACWVLRESEYLDQEFKNLEMLALAEDLPLAVLDGWCEWEALADTFVGAVRCERYDNEARREWKGREEEFEKFSATLEELNARLAIPKVEKERVEALIADELTVFCDANACCAFTRRWWGQEPLLAGERVRVESGDGAGLEAVVRSPGRGGGCTAKDELELEWIAPLKACPGGEKRWFVSALSLAGSGVACAEWCDLRLYRVELARQRPEPPAAFPLSCREGDLVVGDRLWGIEVGEADTEGVVEGGRRRVRIPAVVEVQFGVLEITGRDTGKGGCCKLRELWRSDGEIGREFSAPADEVCFYAGARAWWHHEQERRERIPGYFLLDPFGN